ncbi:MAG: hypothetical protein AAB727_03910 [Patescibacteria group bacterium]
MQFLRDNKNKYGRSTRSALLLSAVLALGFFTPLEFIHAGFWGWAADATFGNIVKWIGEFIFWLSGLFVLVTGWVLDASIAYSLNTTNWALPSVKAAWSIIRDLANMTFIFILLYIAISTILQLGDHKKTLVNLIIIALIINFSLFFTQIVIDAANILSVLFYNAITANGTLEIGEIFRKGLHLESIFTPEQLSGMGNAQAALGYIVGSIVLLLAGFSFLAVGIMFIIRTVALVILMFLSPLALVAWILPQTEAHWKTWWNYLLHQSFFAPIYLLMIFMVAKLITEGNLGGGNWGAVVTGLAPATGTTTTDFSFLSVFITYFIVLFLINGALVVAKKLGGETASLGTKYAGKALGLAMGGMGILGRRTLGRGFAALSRSQKFQGMASQTGLGGFAARQALRGTDIMSRASFDARGMKLAGIAAGKVGTEFGPAAGGGGFEKIQEQQIKTRMGIAKLLGKGAPPDVAQVRQEQYAKILEESGRGPLMTAEAKKTAAEKIRKTFKETTEEKLLEALRKLEEKKEK